MITRERILQLVPHAGRMCLIDEVQSWDLAGIQCVARSHRAADHPLRRFGRLSALHLIEYAAQAAAIHGALRDEAAPPGMLVSVRDFRSEAGNLDAVAASLLIRAHAQLLRPDAVIYGFEIAGRSDQEPLGLLARGRVSVMFAA